ncbi:MAG: hypothetical protein ACTSPV_01765 [Candidatus Hodarchaeales archaeon]
MLMLIVEDYQHIFYSPKNGSKKVEMVDGLQQGIKQVECPPEMNEMAVTDTRNDLKMNEYSKTLDNLPKSAREIYGVLKDNGALKPQEIGSYTTLSNRTIRYALKILIDEQFVQRIPDLHDLRSHYYTLN